MYYFTPFKGSVCYSGFMNINDIRNKTYFLTSTSGIDDFPDEVLIPEANNALERIASLIIQSDGRWQWDDYNNSNLPIATTGLITDQQDYKLQTDHLEVTRMEVLDNNPTPTWHKLIPIDQADIVGQSMTSFMSSSGLPIYYDKIGASVFLYPAPNYTQASSLKLYFQRQPSYFVTSDTTKIPGFNSLYHDLIPLWISYNFAMANGKSNANSLMAEITLREDALREDYALRGRDDHIRLRTTPQRWN